MEIYTVWVSEKLENTIHTWVECVFADKEKAKQAVLKFILQNGIEEAWADLWDTDTGEQLQTDLWHIEKSGN